MRLAREISFDAGARLFEEGHRADRFWIVRTGTVALDQHVPGRRPAVCAADAGFGRATAVWVGRVVAQRLHASRVRLLDLYAPYGSGSLT
ncbi:regulatory protein [Streptomyces collinus Tu 365]|uniref:Regulatory protein n=2 Tax=Streptomyces collinus TaxID=42684 RepID=S5VHR1_STRC3|nr:regulatory protein [Streptomyces collinus Tu 365]